MSAPGRVVMVIVSALVLAACHMTNTVAVVVQPDGSGTVTLSTTFDADAVAKVPDLASALPVGDLASAGWTVSEPTRGADGSVTYQAAKSFASADGLAVVLGELTGPSGFLRDVQLGRERSFGQATWKFSATVNASGGLNALSDPAVAALLGGQPLGRDQATLEGELGAPLASLVATSFAVTLPDDIHANSDTVDGRTAMWTINLGDASPRLLTASSSSSSLAPRLWLLGAAAAGFGLLLVGAARVLRHRHHRDDVETSGGA